jgi:hypothetical protein
MEIGPEELYNNVVDDLIGSLESIFSEYFKKLDISKDITVCTSHLHPKYSAHIVLQYTMNSSRKCGSLTRTFSHKHTSVLYGWLSYSIRNKSSRAV